MRPTSLDSPCKNQTTGLILNTWLVVYAAQGIFYIFKNEHSQNVLNKFNT